jgi:polar amino acid transport system substrate-binding protein
MRSRSKPEIGVYSTMRISGRVPRVIGSVAIAVLTASLIAACGSSSTTPQKPANDAAAGVSYNAALHNELPQSIRNSGVITVADEVNEPFVISGASGKVTGIAPDIYAYLSKLLGVRVAGSLVNGITEAKLGVTSGRDEVAFGPFTDDAAGEQDFNIVDYVYAITTFVHLNSTPISSLADLCRKEISASAGSASVADVATALAAVCKKAGKPAPTYAYFSTKSAIVLAVESGRVDAGEIGAFNALYYRGLHNNLSYIKSPSSEVPYLLCGNFVAKNAGSLGEVLYKAITLLYQKHIVQNIFAKWGIPMSSGVLASGITYNNKAANPPGS